MTSFKRGLAAGVMALSFATGAISISRAEDAMKADPMMADCMKKAGMEKNMKKMKTMEKHCKTDAMGSMKKK
jgi:hypothetical protein